jgi:hypothetical protein
MGFPHRRHIWLAVHDSSGFLRKNDGSQTAGVLLWVRFSGYLLADFVSSPIVKSGSISSDDDSRVPGERQRDGRPDVVVSVGTSFRSMGRNRRRRWSFRGSIPCCVLGNTQRVSQTGSNSDHPGHFGTSSCCSASQSSRFPRQGGVLLLG